MNYNSAHLTSKQQLGVKAKLKSLLIGQKHAPGKRLIPEGISSRPSLPSLPDIIEKKPDIKNFNQLALNWLEGNQFHQDSTEDQLLILQQTWIEQLPILVLFKKQSCVSHILQGMVKKQKKSLIEKIQNKEENQFDVYNKNDEESEFIKNENSDKLIRIEFIPQVLANKNNRNQILLKICGQSMTSTVIYDKNEKSFHQLFQNKKNVKQRSISSICHEGRFILQISEKISSQNIDISQEMQAFFKPLIGRKWLKLDKNVKNQSLSQFDTQEYDNSSDNLNTFLNELYIQTDLDQLEYWQQQRRNGKNVQKQFDEEFYLQSNIQLKHKIFPMLEQYQISNVFKREVLEQFRELLFKKKGIQTCLGIDTFSFSRKHELLIDDITIYDQLTNKQYTLKISLPKGFDSMQQMIEDKLISPETLIDMRAMGCFVNSCELSAQSKALQIGLIVEVKVRYKRQNKKTRFVLFSSLIPLPEFQKVQPIFDSYIDYQKEQFQNRLFQNDFNISNQKGAKEAQDSNEQDDSYKVLKGQWTQEIYNLQAGLANVSLPSQGDAYEINFFLKNIVEIARDIEVKQINISPYKNQITTQISYHGLLQANYQTDFYFLQVQTYSVTFFQNLRHIIQEENYCTKVDYQTNLRIIDKKQPLKMIISRACPIGQPISFVALNSSYLIYTKILFIKTNESRLAVQVDIAGLISQFDQPPTDQKNGKAQLTIDDAQWTPNGAFVIFILGSPGNSPSPGSVPGNLGIGTGTICIIPKFGTSLIQILNPTVFNLPRQIQIMTQRQIISQRQTGGAIESHRRSATHVVSSRQETIIPDQRQNKPKQQEEKQEENLRIKTTKFTKLYFNSVYFLQNDSFKDYKKLLVKYDLQNVYNRWNIDLSPKKTENLAQFTVSNGSLGIIFDFDLKINKKLLEASDDKNQFSFYSKVFQIDQLSQELEVYKNQKLKQKQLKIKQKELWNGQVTLIRFLMSQPGLSLSPINLINLPDVFSQKLPLYQFVKVQDWQALSFKQSIDNWIAEKKQNLDFSNNYISNDRSRGISIMNGDFLKVCEMVFTEQQQQQNIEAQGPLKKEEQALKQEIQQTQKYEAYSVLSSLNKLITIAKIADSNQLNQPFFVWRNEQTKDNLQQNTLNLNFKQWLLTVVNDCFWYMLVKNEPVLGFMILKLAENYFSSDNDPIDFYKIKHVTASKKLRKTYEKNAKENDLEFLDSYRREYRPANMQKAKQFSQACFQAEAASFYTEDGDQNEQQVQMDVNQQIMNDPSTFNALRQSFHDGFGESMGQNPIESKLRLPINSIQNIVPLRYPKSFSFSDFNVQINKQVLLQKSEKIGPQNEKLCESPLQNLTKLGWNSVKSLTNFHQVMANKNLFSTQYTLLMFFSLIQFRNYQATSFNILFLVISAFISQKQMDTSLNQEYQVAMQSFINNYLIRQKINNKDDYIGQPQEEILKTNMVMMPKKLYINTGKKEDLSLFQHQLLDSSIKNYKPDLDKLKNLLAEWNNNQISQLNIKGKMKNRYQKVIKQLNQPNIHRFNKEQTIEEIYSELLLENNDSIIENTLNSQSDLQVLINRICVLILEKKKENNEQKSELLEVFYGKNDQKNRDSEALQKMLVHLNSFDKQKTLEGIKHTIGYLNMKHKNMIKEVIFCSFNLIVHESYDETFKENSQKNFKTSVINACLRQSVILGQFIKFYIKYIEMSMHGLDHKRHIGQVRQASYLLILNKEKHLTNFMKSVELDGFELQLFNILFQEIDKMLQQLRGNIVVEINKYLNQVTKKKDGNSKKKLYKQFQSGQVPVAPADLMTLTHPIDVTTQSKLDTLKSQTCSQSLFEATIPKFQKYLYSQLQELLITELQQFQADKNCKMLTKQFLQGNHESQLNQIKQIRDMSIQKELSELVCNQSVKNINQISQWLQTQIKLQDQQDEFSEFYKLLENSDIEELVKKLMKFFDTQFIIKSTNKPMRMKQVFFQIKKDFSLFFEIYDQKKDYNLDYKSFIYFFFCLGIQTNFVEVQQVFQSVKNQVAIRQDLGDISGIHPGLEESQLDQRSADKKELISLILSSIESVSAVGESQNLGQYEGYTFQEIEQENQKENNNKQEILKLLKDY